MSRGRNRRSPSTGVYISEKTLSKHGGGIKKLQEELREQQEKAEEEQPEPQEPER